MWTKHLVPAAVASILFSSAASAISTETGVVKSLDATKQEIVLDNGKTFEAPSVDLKTFKAGDRIQITYDVKDGKSVATKVETAK